MIVDLLSNAPQYAGISPRVARAFDYLLNTDLRSAGVGRHDIDGDRIYALHSDYVTKGLTEGKWEAHRKYIDLQYVVAGEERIGFAPLSRFSAGAYDAEKDFVPLAGDGNFVTVRPGVFVLLFPADAHMPGIAIATPSRVRKVVVKVSVTD
jgi:YhcH/YjgK/YiaL family protein